jgi:hypothetical protein
VRYDDYDGYDKYDAQADADQDAYEMLLGEILDPMVDAEFERRTEHMTEEEFDSLVEDELRDQIENELRPEAEEEMQERNYGRPCCNDYSCPCH